MKKVLSLLLCIGIVTAIVTPNYASAGVGKNYGVVELKSIERDAMAEGVNLEQLQRTMDTQKKIFEDVQREGANIYKKSQEEIKKAMSDGTWSKVFFKEYAAKNLTANNTINSTVLGSYGDILVSYGFSSFGFNFGSPGHAAICSTTYSSRTIESYPKSASPIDKDGVQYYTNTWGTKTKVYGMRVRNATSTNYRNAGIKAESKIGKPYPSPVTKILWMSKTDDSCYYCSQLVWRAWKDQGIDVDYVKWDNIVSPAELTKSSNTYCWYYQP